MTKQSGKGAALIAGASAGIGAVYADRLARRGLLADGFGPSAIGWFAAAIYGAGNLPPPPTASSAGRG